MKLTIRIILFLSIIFLAGCYYDSEEVLYPKLSNPCDDTVVTFSGTVTQILQPCRSCHSNSNASSSGNRIRLENYSDVQAAAKSEKLMGAISHSNGFVAMPKDGGKLSDCEISQLQKWIDNGTLNN
ncbi:MAG: hypothetical protein Q8N05_14800 [Bacteroidota bacterium]|nr:hypothetical protein [Bacteroidota bacterium]